MGWLEEKEGQLLFKALPDGQKVHKSEGAHACFAQAMAYLRPVTAAPPGDMDGAGVTPRRRSE
jgi:hypothetical protein